jgi:(1->4)-alpha-D-glucan 1-alpha-D-glucosylmutase
MAWEEIARTHQGSDPAVTASDRYYFYQSVVGALPFGLTWGDRLPDEFVRRACEHMAKATKEEKRETRWTQPDEAYDEAVQRFTAGMLGDPRFAADVTAFVASIARAGVTNSLGQIALKLTSPGVPDVYQGTELWCLDFCDPDNRRPVDFERRRAWLRQLRASDDRTRAAAAELDRFEDGRIKMRVCHALLRMRRELPGLFLDGPYDRLEASAPFEEHVVAFVREGAGRRLVTAATRHSLTLVKGAERWSVGDAWGDASLDVPAGRYDDVLTGRSLTSEGSLAVRDLFEVLPVAVLVTSDAR